MTAELEEVAMYWKGEVERLQRQLRAERLDNNRLRAACAHFKGAAEAGYATIKLARTHYDETNEGISGLDSVLDSMADSIDEGDDLMLPEAKEEAAS